MKNRNEYMREYRLKNYDKWQKMTNRNKKRTLTEEDRIEFESKLIMQPDGCWIWTGCVRDKSKKNKYGSFKGRRTNIASYQLYKGEIPEGMVVAHNCNVTLCCNPNHLRLDTQLGNMHDTLGIKKPRIQESNSN